MSPPASSPPKSSSAAEVHFHGAAREVTGSLHRVVCAAGTLLIDCGAYQGGSSEANWREFPFKPSEIDAVVLTHAHIDHSGRLPMLCRAGFRGPIHAHPATRDLCRILLEDSAHIHEKEARDERRSGKESGSRERPLFNREDVARTMELFEPLEYNDEREVLKGVTISLADAGHILGSAIVQLVIRTEEGARRIVFSGDLGHYGKPVLRDPESGGRADLVVMECTYGDRDHRSWEETWNELGEILTEADHDRGNVLIPSFAVGRTQQLLHAFQRHHQEWRLNRWRIYLDSPLAIEATRVYYRHEEVYDELASRAHRRHGSPFALPNLKVCQRREDSMRLNAIESGAIIIAGSGMCTGGRIQHHLAHHATRPGSHIIIVGFQAQGTLGRALVDGERKVRLLGEEREVKARVHTLGGLSAHAGANGLMHWYGAFSPPPKVALVHGEVHAMSRLAERLTSEMGATKVFQPDSGDSVRV